MTPAFSARGDWDSYVARQHHYIERLLRHGEVPTHEACPQFFAQQVASDLVNLARCLNAVHTVKTAKARSNTMETVTQLLQNMPGQKVAELTAESGNVIARVVTEAAEFVYMAALRDNVGKHLAEASRAKPPETRQKYLAAALAVIDATPVTWKHPDGPIVVAALREAIAQVAATAQQLASELESDADRLRLAPSRAFDWVGRELQFPTNVERQAFKAAFLAVKNEGHRAVKKLEVVWPHGARWPSGEAYLRTLGWRAADELADDDAADVYADKYDGPELMELLYQRLNHVGHRMYRDTQVRGMLDPSSPRRIRTYTHACLNRDGEFRGDPCGHGMEKIISIEDALKLMEQPAHDHPACACTVDPYPV